MVGQSLFVHPCSGLGSPCRAEEPCAVPRQDFRLASETRKAPGGLCRPSQRLLEQQLCATLTQTAGLEGAAHKADVPGPYVVQVGMSARPAKPRQRDPCAMCETDLHIARRDGPVHVPSH